METVGSTCRSEPVRDRVSVITSRCSKRPWRWPPSSGELKSVPYERTSHWPYRSPRLPQKPYPPECAPEAQAATQRRNCGEPCGHRHRRPHNRPSSVPSEAKHCAPTDPGRQDLPPRGTRARSSRDQLIWQHCLDSGDHLGRVGHRPRAEPVDRCSAGGDEELLEVPLHVAGLAAGVGRLGQFRV